MIENLKANNSSTSKFKLKNDAVAESLTDFSTSKLNNRKKNQKLVNFEAVTSKVKNYKKTALILLLLSICIIFITNPKIYSTCCLDAISVWAFKVLPALFPFFIITKIIVELLTPKQTKLDKLFNKLYHTPTTSSAVYFLSILSGYPMGAKLICNMHERGVYTKDDAKRMLSFCSVSGPMFMVGSVGVAIFSNYTVGLIILIANVVASLINGLIYRGKKQPLKECETNEKGMPSSVLADSVNEALSSILMVGAYMVLAFLSIEILNNLKMIPFLTTGISSILHIKDTGVIQAFIAGLFEITHGAISINSCVCSLQLKVILTAGLIGFGGVSIFLQSMYFIKKLGIKPQFVALQKLTQGLIASLVAIPLSLICL